MLDGIIHMCASNWLDDDSLGLDNNRPHGPAQEIITLILLFILLISLYLSITLFFSYTYVYIRVYIL